MSLAGHTILVVEDESLIALDLQTAFEDVGATVFVARRLSVALDCLGQTVLSAAIVDDRLDGEYSDALCAALRERDIPFLLYTGGARILPPDVPFVSKPAFMDVVVATLTSIVAAHSVTKVPRSAMH